jgi:hypothetical protein
MLSSLSEVLSEYSSLSHIATSSLLMSSLSQCVVGPSKRHGSMQSVSVVMGGRLGKQGMSVGLYKSSGELGGMEPL